MSKITCLVITCHLSSLLRWILLGPNQNLTPESPNSFSKKLYFFGNPVHETNLKIRYQMRYSHVTGSHRQVSNYVETPLSGNLGSMLYQTTGSIILTNTLYDINMLISYNKVAYIKQDVAEAVRKKVQDSSGVFIPSCITLFNNVVFVIDSTD